MKNYYRLNVRFDMDMPRERAAAEYLMQLGGRSHKSMNGFIIDAVCKALEAEQASRDFSLEDIKEVFQDVLGRTFTVAPGGNIQPVPFTPALSEIDREERDAMVLEDLSMFGC